MGILPSVPIGQPVRVPWGAEPEGKGTPVRLLPEKNHSRILFSGALK